VSWVAREGGSWPFQAHQKQRQHVWSGEQGHHLVESRYTLSGISLAGVGWSTTGEGEGG